MHLGTRLRGYDNASDFAKLFVGVTPGLQTVSQLVMDPKGRGCHAGLDPVSRD